METPWFDVIVEQRCGGLKDMPDAIGEIWPQAVVQRAGSRALLR
jgi:hypothetical protein